MINFKNSKYLYLIERDNFIFQHKEYKRFEFVYTSLRKFNSNKNKGIQLFEPLFVFNPSKVKNEIFKKIKENEEKSKESIRHNLNLENSYFSDEDKEEIVNSCFNRNAILIMINDSLYFSTKIPFYILTNMLEEIIEEYKINNDVISLRSY